MSSIGSANVGALNLAGSLAGTQRSEADADRVKADSADRKFQIDQQSLSARGMDDVAETDLSTDRDADGRLPYGQMSNPEDAVQSDGEHSSEHRNRDASGERGIALDLQA